MNKILVLFDSATGNVQQMADLVGEGAALVPDTNCSTVLQQLDSALGELQECYISCGC